MKPLIIANWKMNPRSLREARLLFARVGRGLRRVRGVEVAVAPPAPYLASAGRGSRRVLLAAQDVFWEQSGAYTGEVSPAMLKDLGVHYVILGHSERRRLLGETGEMVNRKVRAAIRSGLVPVIAIGESERDADEVVPAELSHQLSSAIAGIPRRWLRGMVVAYEPVWAISTTPGARPDTPDGATRRAIYIRKLLTKAIGPRLADTVRIIYGGSVRAANAAAYLSRDIRGMEGLLVGGASLNAGEFIGIVRSVAEARRKR